MTPVRERHVSRVAPPFSKTTPYKNIVDKNASRLRAAALALGILYGGSAPAAAAVGAAVPGTRDALDNPALHSGGQSYLPGVILVKFANALFEAPGTSGRDFRESRITGSRALDELVTAHQVSRIEPVALRGPLRPGGTDLSRVYALHYQSGEDAMDVARRFAARAEVEYAEPQFVYGLETLPGDPLYAVEQSAYFARMAFPAAFDMARGADGGVVIAIVDGGTEWRHEDLQDNLWSNPGETLNGADDDGNGFVDDLHGWNFANGTNDPTGLAATPGSAGHGTHVSGIACAVTDNARGVAGASWNARFMPVCVSHPTTDGAVVYGYQGILYAVGAGADIVSCSWGGAGNPSRFEQEVIDYAQEQGVVVVAAAGNNNSSSFFYPAAYEHVLAVANVTNSDVKVASSNFGVWVDVAAQGNSIHSTYRGGGYTDLSGTSMSTPHAAAACALVKTRFPAYSAAQVRERVRVTCDNIEAANPSYVGLLGFGRLNAAQALAKTTPAIRIQEVAVSTSDGDAIVEPGETVALQVTVVNHLDAATQVSFTLLEESAYASVTSGIASLPDIGAGEIVRLADLTVAISGAAPVNHVVPCVLRVTTASPSYADVDRFELRVLPIVATHEANNVVTSITSVGRLGFAEKSGGNGKDGIGFLFAGSPNLLFEGALLIGTGPTRISNAARGANPRVLDNDFLTAPNGIPVITTPAGGADEYGIASFTDARATSPLGLTVRQDSRELAHAPFDDFVLLQFTLHNGGAPLSGLYVGWFLDWDVDGVSYATNRTGFDAGRGLGYVWDDGAGPNTHVGIATLTQPGTTACRGIWNDENHPSNPSWGVYDGFTDAEKWEALSGGILYPNAGPADISQVLATGPFALGSGDSLCVVFAVLGGSDLADLRANADMARSVWESTTDAVPVRSPRGLRLAQNVPNPFNPETRITFELPRASEVMLQVYGASGRLVRTLVAGRREAGAHGVLWDGTDAGGRPAPSGTYFVRLTAAGENLARKVLLVK